MEKKKNRIAIFASGDCTNARTLIEEFKDSNIEIVLVVCDKKNAKVLDIANEFDIDSVLIKKDSEYKRDDLNDVKFMTGLLEQYDLDLIILAGFMRIIPEYLIEKFPKKILNIHPSNNEEDNGKTIKTIPGDVIKEKRKRHGVKVHYVVEAVDEGETLDFEEFDVEEKWDEATLREVIRKTEHLLYKRAIKTFFNR